MTGDPDSSVVVAFRFVGKSMSALSIGTNMGDQSFHRELEQFEAHLKERLNGGDEKEFCYVADCLAKSYKRAVSESEELAEEICTGIMGIVTRLCAASDELRPVLENQGRHGKIIVSYLDGGQAERRAFI